MNNQNISAREREVLHLIKHEYTAKEIASVLYMITHTVDSHRKNLLKKLHVKNTAGVVRVAFESFIISKLI